jgi:hypothetical protein
MKTERENEDEKENEGRGALVPICRSLLASDPKYGPLAGMPNRLPVRQAQGPEPVEGQAGSYIRANSGGQVRVIPIARRQTKTALIERRYS